MCVRQLKHIYIYIYIYICVCVCIYIYIYIQKLVPPNVQDMVTALQRMQSIEEKFSEENSLQFQAEVSFNTRDGVRRPLCIHSQYNTNYTLTEVTNYVITYVKRILVG